MTHEVPPVGPDWYSRFPEGYPPAGLFNLDAMTDGQIISMGLAFDRDIWREDASPDPTSADGTDALFEHLGSDLAQLAVHNPERGLSLLDRLARSDDESERRIALAACPPLCRSDYETGSRIFLTAVDKTKEVRGNQDDLAGAQSLTTRLLPPDLAHELDRRAYDRWPEGE